MPPRLMSRYEFTSAVSDSNGALVLTDREPYRYVNLPDNSQHVATIGDTWWNLAARYFAPLDNAADLWWVIADFQPDPVLDPTIAIVVGRVIIIPSVDTVQSRIFDETRRDD